MKRARERKIRIVPATAARTGMATSVAEGVLVPEGCGVWVVMMGDGVGVVDILVGEGVRDEVLTEDVVIDDDDEDSCRGWSRCIVLPAAALEGKSLVFVKKLIDWIAVRVGMRKREGWACDVIVWR